MTRKLVFAVMLISLSPVALADTLTTYSISFSLDAGYSPAPASGSFTYDSTNPLFSNFLVSWAGVTFDLTASANAPHVTGSGCTGEASTPSFGFTIMSQSASGCSNPIAYYWGGLFDSGGFAEFGFGLYDTNSGVSQDFFSTSLHASNSPFGPTAQGNWSITPGSTVTTPEPSAFALLGIGIVALLGMRRRLAML